MSKALVLALATIVLLLLLATPHVGTQAQDRVEVGMRWVKYINPTGSGDSAHGTCVFGDYIAVVGKVGWTPPHFAREGKPYVALLRKGDGGVVKEWTGSEAGGFSNCISIDGKLYAVGDTKVGGDYYGAIYVFDENLNVLARIAGGGRSYYSSLAYDGKALYLGGLAYEDVNGDGIQEQVWLVEKRDPGDLSLIASKRMHLGSWQYGWIHDIGVEPSTDRVWAVGSYQEPGGRWHSLIVAFDSSLGDFKVIDYPEGSKGYLGGLTGIAFDGWRHAYIAGIDGVAKFSADGELVAVNRDVRARYKIVYYNNYLYTFGESWLYILDTNLNIVKEYMLSENVNAPPDFREGRPTLEGNNIYVAGFDYALGYPNTRITVYSLSIEVVTEGTTATATATPAYTKAPTTTIVSEGASTLLIAAGLAAIGIALAIAFLLLRRR